MRVADAGVPGRDRRTDGPAGRPRFTIGHLGADLIIARARGESAPPPHPLLSELERARDLGFRAVEDYIGWNVVEPREGRFDFEAHLSHRDAVRGAGLEYVIYPWVHAVPGWAERDVVRPRCMEHGRATPALSMHAPSTLKAYERLYGAIATHLGAPDGCTVACPADYGEAGYPVGCGAWALESPSSAAHAHEGFFCAEDPAVESFRRFALERFESLSGVNRAFGTDFPTADRIAPPGDPAAPWLHPAYREAFLRWYRLGVVRFLDRALHIARAHFPAARLAFKCGFAGERAAYGVDVAALADLARRHGAELWSTHAGVGVVFQKRYLSACRVRAVPFVSESLSERDEADVRARLFLDAADGVSGVFEFHDAVARFAATWRSHAPRILDGAPRLDVALLFNDTSQVLRPNQAFPPRLLELGEPLRDLIDFDVVGEPDLERALADRGVIALPDGGPLGRRTLEALLRFAREGGVVVADAKSPPRSPEAGEAWGFPRPNRAPASAFAIYTHRAPRAFTLAFDGGDAWFAGGAIDLLESAHAYFRDAAPDAKARWIGGRAEYRLPLAREDPAAVDLALFAPARAQPSEWLVRVDGEPHSRLVEGENRIRIDAPARPDSSVLRLSFEGPTFLPRLFGSREDERRLGILLFRAAARSRGAEASLSPPPPLCGELTDEAARAWFQPLGRGGVLFAPGGDRHAFAMAVHYASAHRSRLLPGASDFPQPPPHPGGVRMARFERRVLLFCRGPERTAFFWPGVLDREVVLDPGEIAEIAVPAGEPGPPPPASADQAGSAASRSAAR